MNTARLKPGHPLLREPLFRFRLVVLIAVTALFTLILYPNLLVTKLAYTAGDVAEKDIVDLSQRLIQPNITLNRNETEDRKHRAAAEIKPVLYRVKAGEMLLREGERVADLHMLKLRALESQTKPEQFFLGTLGAAAVIFSLIAVIYLLFLERGLHPSQTPARDILLMACMFLFFQLLAQAMSSFLELVLRNSHYAIPVWTEVFAVPLVAAPMTICVFLGLPAASAALSFAVVTAFGAAVAFGNSLPMCAYYLVTGSMGAYWIWIRNCRERKVFVTAGAKTGLLSVILAAAAGCFLQEFSWTGLLWSSVFAFLGGIGSGVVAGGIVPLTEIVQENDFR